MRQNPASWTVVQNSFVNDKEFNAMAARSGGCYLMDVGLTIADIATMSILYNTMGVQPDDAPPSDRMPMDVPYQITVPARETITLRGSSPAPLPERGPTTRARSTSVRNWPRRATAQAMWAVKTSRG